LPGLMQNVPNDAQRRLVDALKLLDGEKIDDAIKVRTLGLNLLNIVGSAVLTAAAGYEPTPPIRTSTRLRGPN